MKFVVKQSACWTLTATLAFGLTGCGNSDQGATTADSSTVRISLMQVGDIPKTGNDIETGLEKHIGKDLDIQWIPSSAFNDKVNVMIASGNLPHIMRLNYIPTTVGAIRSDQFWEIGPYLKDYPNLSAQDPEYYSNITVDGKLYGIPNFRDIGRAAIVYRKDWFDTLKLGVPKSVDDWYNAAKAIATQDPDGNGKNDTYAFPLFKTYTEGSQAPLTRIAVSLGGVNRWGVDNSGKFTPEFITPQYTEVLQMMHRLYAEKLINADFPSLDSTEADKMMASGRIGMKLNGVATNGKSTQQLLTAAVPDGVVDISPFVGPEGIRIAGEPGNFGFLAFPKATVQDEAQLKDLLSTLDKLMDEPTSTLQLRGIENKHYKKTADGKTEFIDFDGYQRDVKPYRDNLLNIEGYNVPELIDTELGTKGVKLSKDDRKYAVSNPAYNLVSDIYTERGQELDQMISDAQTKYIMGELDDAGWQQAITSWRTAGGDQLIKEYEEAYAKLNK